jgi:hypothetical protein
VTSVRSLAAIVLAATLGLGATLPRHGVLVAGQSLGGLRLGETRAQVRAAWGSRYGLCRDCADETWYYTYRKFAAEGAGVAFRNGRVAAIFTLWSPVGWRASRGLRLGEDAARVTDLYGALPQVSCGRYYAIIETRSGTTTAVYVLDGKVWGFGLSRTQVPVCR